MNTEHIRIKILENKDMGYNLMKIISASIKYDTNSLNKTTDIITVSIPDGVKHIQIEALTNNEFNIFYRR